MTRMENASGPPREGITRNLHTSVDVEGLKLVTSISEKVENLPLFSPDCCIYRVPKRLRELNEKAYTPLVVSIGPLHHGKQGLEAMEEHKWGYLKDFLKHSGKPILEFVEFIREREGRIRECYAETVNLDSDEFVKIVLVDAAFIIEIFLRNYWSSDHLKTDNDRIYGRPWMIRDIWSDLFLLENQIPFFVLEGLFSAANIKEAPTLMELPCTFFARARILTNNIGLEQNIDPSKVGHLIDFRRSCLIPRESILSQKLTRITHLTPSATELNDAGVKFKVSSSKNLFDLKFSTKGVLEIPYIKIVDEAEIYLRNLIAFEQCHYRNGFMSDYVSFMDNLINTSKDVELLAQSGVTENWLANSHDVANLFHKLNTGVLIDPDNYQFAQVSKDLKDHCRIPWNKWKATLRHDYCNTPWQVLSIVVVAILLVLTLIQTVCSIKSVRRNY